MSVVPDDLELNDAGYLLGLRLDRLLVVSGNVGNDAGIFKKDRIRGMRDRLPDLPNHDLEEPAKNDDFWTF